MNNFQPKFKVVNDIALCADLINRPHEDYPQRVPVTESMLRVLHEQNYESIMDFDVKMIHNIVMADLSDQSQKGRWRTSEVIVGNDSTCPPYLIDDEIKEQGLFPITNQSSREELIDWYRRFQIIHPFLDGNGRVGGIVVALLSYNESDGTMLAPCQ